MSIPMHAASTQTFVRMLNNEKSWLLKAAAFAEAKKFDANNFLSLRLAPDMFTFARQVQISTDHAKNGVARLAQIEPPPFPDDETTLAQLVARIERCVAFLESVPADKLAGAEAREIRFGSARGERVFENGNVYLLSYVLPNFYFHSTTAYAILRHAGVDLGKVDFLMGGTPR